ncbi:hypothetical protein AKJ09_05765 [Labilithrix luteola]|uniref:Uncharacterized protein n=1 Tax=Labilithrix luteola TaxID=1391654 RepID=A0A0K1Q0C4_9BACT|nr:hypothetical protein AKJ09_05765 [Labilithrix luteola]
MGARAIGAEARRVRLSDRIPIDERSINVGHAAVVSRSGARTTA